MSSRDCDCTCHNGHGTQTSCAHCMSSTPLVVRREPVPTVIVPARGPWPPFDDMGSYLDGEVAS